MNAPLRQVDVAPHRFTAEEVTEFVRVGVFGDGRVELVDGRIFDMPADGALHSAWTMRLNWWLNESLGRTYGIMPNATLWLGDADMPSPDWFVFTPVANPLDVRGPDVLLVIELSDSSLKRDLGEKAALYARYGVRDYWVIELEAGRVHIHRQPSATGYADVQAFDDKAVAALLIPGLTLRIADLPRVGG